MALPIIPILIAGGLGIWNYQKLNNKPHKIFISYYAKKDSRYKNMLIAWSKNKKFELKLEDFSTDVSINSNNETYLKKRMKDQIMKADNFLIFIGKDTHKRKWVAWEIAQAKMLNKKIIAIKENKTHKSPACLLGIGTIWVYGFSELGLRNALI
jgi:hypothetical protein